MSSYSRSAETKQMIVNLARKFFWEQGFDNTRYQDFSKLGINPGLIHYYFKSKESLACVIYNDLVEQCSSLILQIMDCADNTLLRAAGCATVIWRYMDSSINFTRFYSEIANHRIPVENALEEDIYFIRELNREYRLNRNDSEIILLNRICSSISNELVLSYTNSLTPYSANELAIYEIKCVFHVINIGEKEVNEILEKVEEMLKQYEFFMEPDFKMCYRMKNELQT